MRFLRRMLDLYFYGIVVWKVKAHGSYCVFEHFSEAWDDFKSHGDYPKSGRRIYPKLMTVMEFRKLPEFTGW